MPPPLAGVLPPRVPATVGDDKLRPAGSAGASAMRFLLGSAADERQRSSIRGCIFRHKDYLQATCDEIPSRFFGHKYRQ